MRIAYIGLSAPFCYDYLHYASKAPSDDTPVSPNPILESPFGLLLLYDEIWFLCRSLCPENMREIPYVRFLDESGKLPSLKDIGLIFQPFSGSSSEVINKRLGKIQTAEVLNGLYKKIPHVRKEQEKKKLPVAAGDWQIPIFVEMGIDWTYPHNHTKRLRIADITIYANSSSPECLIFDLIVVERLRNKNIELITNSHSQSWLENPNNPIIKAKFAELLIIDNIPNYLTPEGPYHPCVEKARDNPFLKDFRKWIVSQSITANKKELRDIKSEVEAAIQKSQNEIFLKYLDRKTQYMSIGKTMAGAGADLIVPGLSATASILKEGVNFFDKRKRRWQGFIVSLRSLRTKR